LAAVEAVDLAKSGNGKAARVARRRDEGRLGSLKMWKGVDVKVEGRRKIREGA
jgi:hypothetical protein